MPVVAIAQARMGSTRVPGKVMRMLDGTPVLDWTLNALFRASGIDHVVLATSNLPQDDKIAAWCEVHDIECFRGSESDVLDRFYRCAVEYKADVVLRLTCDCPFLDPNVVSEVIKLRERENADYASNVDPPSYPDGLDVECFTFAALETAWREATSPTDRDCVTQYIVRNRSRFSAVNLRCPLPRMAGERWVLDTEKDWDFCQEVVRLGGWGLNPPSYMEVLHVLDRNPHVRDINKAGVRNERFFDALAEEQQTTKNYVRSDRDLEKALKHIPFGAQTFSKSFIQFPRGRAPLFASHGDGAYIFDVDGNRYVDLINAILPVVLGYRDPDVDEAIRRQLDRGISFSLATELEEELASLMSRMIPCAEMVKFAKSGTDVTTAAVRLARAITGKDHILITGYHGWNDWSMACTDRNIGIPEAVGRLTSRVTYGDIAAFDAAVTNLNGEVAAIIVEPNDDPMFLRDLRQFCTLKGIIMIMDEVITGFRYSLGGAQSLYSVTPDLATFGKAMANGMPISALCGRQEYMKRCAPPNNIFFSGTMFGETLSIAAAIACINKIRRENVIPHLWSTGQRIMTRIEDTIDATDLQGVVKLSGKAPRSILSFRGHREASADEVRTLFMIEMAKNGALIINSNNISFAMKEPEIKRIDKAYQAAFNSIRDGDIQRKIGNAIVEAKPLRDTPWFS